MKDLGDMIAALPARERKAIRTRADELIAEEMTLAQLRKAMGKTQVQLSRLTGKPQTVISRIEQQSDVLLSTLSEIVGAMGGRVRIVAELPGRAPVALTGFGDLARPEKPAQRRRAKAAV